MPPKRKRLTIAGLTCGLIAVSAFASLAAEGTTAVPTKRLRAIVASDFPPLPVTNSDPEDPTQPSWGGQYVRQGSTTHYVDVPGAETIRKWRPDFQAEFKEHATWTLP